MSKPAPQPLNDLERFDVLQAMFPGKLTDDDFGNEEQFIYDEFGIYPEDFDKLVGRLVMLAPVMRSPLSGEAHHVLGSITVDGEQSHMVAAVKRKA